MFQSVSGIKGTISVGDTSIRYSKTLTSASSNWESPRVLEGAERSHLYMMKSSSSLLLPSVVAAPDTRSHLLNFAL